MQICKSPPQKQKGKSSGKNHENGDMVQVAVTRMAVITESGQLLWARFPASIISSSAQRSREVLVLERLWGLRSAHGLWRQATRFKPHLQPFLVWEPRQRPKPLSASVSPSVEKVQDDPDFGIVSHVLVAHRNSQ